MYAFDLKLLKSWTLYLMNCQHILYSVCNAFYMKHVLPYPSQAGQLVILDMHPDMASNSNMAPNVAHNMALNTVPNMALNVAHNMALNTVPNMAQEDPRLVCTPTPGKGIPIMTITMTITH